MCANQSDHVQDLKPGKLLLWTVLTDDFDGAIVEDCLHSILSVDEQKRAERFHLAADRKQFIAAYTLLRIALSHHLAIPAGTFRFERDHNRKPFLVAPEVSPSVQFNISHTRGRVACLITLSPQAGVDVEEIANRQDHATTAKLTFSPTELQELSVLTGATRTERFFDHWTLKEAYAKARGLGLILKLSDVEFAFESNNQIVARFSSKLEDDPSNWIFWRGRLSSRHIISVAAKRNFAAEHVLILRSATIIAANQARVSFTDVRFDAFNQLVVA